MGGRVLGPFGATAQLHALTFPKQAADTEAQAIVYAKELKWIKVNQWGISFMDYANLGVEILWGL